jgi:hypothetical protein
MNMKADEQSRRVTDRQSKKKADEYTTRRPVELTNRQADDKHRQDIQAD